MHAIGEISCEWEEDIPWEEMTDAQKARAWERMDDEAQDRLVLDLPNGPERARLEFELMTMKELRDRAKDLEASAT